MNKQKTITPEERERIRAIAARRNYLSHRDGIHDKMNNLLDALEAVEARAEKAEAEIVIVKEERYWLARYIAKQSDRNSAYWLLRAQDGAECHRKRAMEREK